MKFPRGKGFDLACGSVITVVLDDLVTLTGTFLGETQESSSHHRRIEFHEFILIQLKCPFHEKCGPHIPEGTFVAISIDKIQFIIPGIKCGKKHDDECDDGCHEGKHDDKCDDECHHDKHGHKFHGKSHGGKHDDICEIECHEGKHDNAHIINISCHRDDTKQDEDNSSDKKN